MSSLKLVTLNIAHGRGLSFYQGFSSQKQIYRNLTRIANFLNKVDPDIVALQEVDERSHWNKHIDLLKVIQDLTTYHYSIIGINTRREGDKPLAYGNAILSKYPVREWHNQPFGTRTLGEKGFLYAQIEVQKKLLSVVNLHLDYKSRKRRVQQIENILDYIHEHHFTESGHEICPPIICGDFNSRSAPAGDAINHLFNHILSHHDYRLYPEKARTFPTYFPSKGIDFVFLPYDFRKISCEVSKTFISDHRPVVLEFDLLENYQSETA